MYTEQADRKDMNKSKPDQSFNPTTRHEEVLQSESTEPVQRDELDSELSGSNGPTLDQEEHVLQSELHVAVPVPQSINDLAKTFGRLAVSRDSPLRREIEHLEAKFELKSRQYEKLQRDNEELRNDMQKAGATSSVMTTAALNFKRLNNLSKEKLSYCMKLREIELQERTKLRNRHRCVFCMEFIESEEYLLVQCGHKTHLECARWSDPWDKCKCGMNMTRRGG